MYLSHHYIVDLVGGSLLSAAIFFAARSRFLPRPQPRKTFRWDYDYVECGEDVRVNRDIYDLAEDDDFNHLDSDD